MKHVTELELIEYAAGSIAQPQKVLLDAHLAKCESCRQILEQNTLVYHSLAEFAAPKVNDLTQRVRQGVASRQFFAWRQFAYNLVRVAAVVIISASAGYFVALKFAPAHQSDSASMLEQQSEISFVQPARHIALAVAGAAQ
jgi:predicted anti-sigma-YlaC factor YlaD